MTTSNVMELEGLISSSSHRIMSCNSIELAIEAGEALVELKLLVASKGQPHWKKWREYINNHPNFPSYKQAIKYVKLANNKKLITDKKFYSINEAVKFLSKPKNITEKPVSLLDRILKFLKRLWEDF